MARMRDFGPNEIVVEVAVPRNCQYAFKAPLHMALRGRWERQNMAGVMNQDSPYQKLPTVPGMMVAVDIKARTIRAVDPLSFEENADLLAEVHRCCKAAGEGDVGPQPESKLAGLTESEVKTALWHLWEMLNPGTGRDGKPKEPKARPVKGDLPRKADILAMPGQLLLREGTIETAYDRVSEKPLPKYATEEEMARIRGEPVASP